MTTNEKQIAIAIAILLLLFLLRKKPQPSTTVNVQVNDPNLPEIDGQTVQPDQADPNALDVFL